MTTQDESKEKSLTQEELAAYEEVATKTIELLGPLLAKKLKSLKLLYTEDGALFISQILGTISTSIICALSNGPGQAALAVSSFNYCLKRTVYKALSKSNEFSEPQKAADNFAELVKEADSDKNRFKMKTFSSKPICEEKLNDR